jgi:hypothetical protein
MKYFFLHIPKTAGTYFNNFLKAQTNNFFDHIEVNKFSLDADILSGHINYLKAYKDNLLYNRKIIVLLRSPIHQLISHITFVRELAEPTEKERFKSHSKAIQNIAIKLKETDLSKAEDIEKFIVWLEKNNYWLFHDCQTRYLGGGKDYIKPQNLKMALDNLEKIDYVGITERLKEFMIFLSIKEKFKLIEYKKENITKSRYGLNINNPEIIKVLLRLIEYDNILYSYARKKFIKDFHNVLGEYEIKKSFSYSTINVKNLFAEFLKKEKNNIKGVIDKITSKTVSGWVINTENMEKEVEVILYVNSKEIKKIKANKFRKDIKDKGIHPTGNCGFVFSLDKELKSTDKIEVKTDNGIILNKSTNIKEKR